MFKVRQKVLLGLLILLLVLGIFSIVYAVMNPERNVFDYISGLAVVVLAMLTMAYVYVTSRQLDVMSGQLKEMETESRLQNQPLPYINSVDVLIEKPTFFYTVEVKGNEYSAQARYGARIKVRNVGSHPAVCIDISARIEVPVKDRKRYFSSTSISIPTLGEKEDYTIKKGDLGTFLFANDVEGVLIEALREEEPDKLPLLNFRILFRNIMGGCFLLSCSYRLYPQKEEDDSLFANWLTEMNSFWIKNKNDIEKLKSLTHSNEGKWREEFDKLGKSFKESMKGEDIKLYAWMMPGSFAIKSIEPEDYEKEMGDISYGVKVSALESKFVPKSIIE